jgi:hypothetical protein
VDVLNVLVDEAEQAQLNHVVDDSQQKKNQENEVSSMPQVLYRVGDVLLINGGSQDVMIPFSLVLAGRH